MHELCIQGSVLHSSHIRESDFRHEFVHSLNSLFIHKRCLLINRPTNGVSFLTAVHVCHMMQGRCSIMEEMPARLCRNACTSVLSTEKSQRDVLSDAPLNSRDFDRIALLGS